MRLHQKIRLPLISITVLASFLALGGLSLLDFSARSQAHGPVSEVFPNCPSVLIASGQTIQGSIDSGDCEYQSALGDLFTFEAQAGDQVILTMTSTEFDSVLELYTNGGELITQDDDGGTFSNSRIVYKLETSGTYLFLARSFSGNETGAYELHGESIDTPCVLQPSGLVAWFKGEDNSLDSSGAFTLPQYTGTFSSGQIGNALKFDGASSVYSGIDRGEESSLVDRWSVAVWIKADSIEGERYLASLRTRNRNRGFDLLLVDGKIRLDANLENEGREIVTTNEVVVVPGVYQHLVVVFEAKSDYMSIFLNGNEVASTRSNASIDSSISVLPGGLILGAKSIVSGGSTPLESPSFAGELDELQIFNRRLSTKAIQSLAVPSVTGVCENRRVTGNLQLPNVRIQTADGLRSTFSDKNGNYQLYLELGRDHSLHPVLSSHSFNPASRNVVDLNEDSAGMDFTPTLQNDDFENAIILTGKSGDVAGVNSTATRQTGEPLHANVPGINSVWYRWTAPENGEFNFSLAGSKMDTMLAVYSGTTINSLGPVKANDDIPNIATYSQVEIQAVAGTVYYIAIDGKPGPFSAGEFRLVFHRKATSGWKVSGTVNGARTVTGTPFQPLNGAVVIITNRQGQVLNSAVSGSAGYYEFRVQSGSAFHSKAYHHVLDLRQSPSPSFYFAEAYFFDISDDHVYDFNRELSTFGDLITFGKIFGLSETTGLSVIATGPSISGDLQCSISGFGYTCAGIPNYAAVKVTPRLANATFSPPFLESSGANNILNGNFYASLLPGRRISGKVSDAGSPLLTAKVRLLDDPGPLQTSTDVEVDIDGFYKFENLSDGIYEISAALAGFSCQAMTVELQNDETVNVACSSTCTYAISTPSETVSSTGGFFNLDIVTSAGCAWSAQTGSEGFTLMATGGSGSKPVPYYVTENTGEPRTGHIFIAGQSISVQQSGSMSITGRALSPGGVSLKNVQVFLTKPNGDVLKTGSSSLGYFTFPGVHIGQEYIIRAFSKRYRFASRSVAPTNNLTEFDLVGLE